MQNLRHSLESAEAGSHSDDTHPQPNQPPRNARPPARRRGGDQRGTQDGHCLFPARPAAHRRSGGQAAWKVTESLLWGREEEGTRMVSRRGRFSQLQRSSHRGPQRSERGSELGHHPSSAVPRGHVEYLQGEQLPASGLSSK